MVGARSVSEYDNPIEVLVMSQDAWNQYCKKVGEDQANKELARQLRMAADFVEAGGWPKVFAAKLFPDGSDDLPEFIGSISVTLSYPWPG